MKLFVTIISLFVLSACNATTVSTIGNIRSLPEKVGEAKNIIQDMGLDALDLSLRKARENLAEREAKIELNYIRDKTQIKRAWQILGGKVIVLPLLNE